MNYQILEWNPVLIGNETFPLPMAYIKPDEKLLKYIQNNNNLINVSVKNTYIYDNHKTNLYGFIVSSLNFPNYRPNFYNKNGYYCVIIKTNWSGYPKDSGNITFNDITHNIENPTEVVPYYSLF